VNDTIVIFDRVRENFKVHRRDSLETMLNVSINQTLSRTILTSGLTLISVLALFIFGGEIINHFAFAMVVGVIVGSYSTIAIAAPVVLVYTKVRGASAVQAVVGGRPVGSKGPRPAKVK
jgi:preprotein translocase subunit SecF